MKNPLFFTGTTPDGILLLGGLFTLKDTRGFPLDMSYEICKERHCCPDWFEYLLDAGRQEGWKWGSAAEEMKLLVGNQLGEEIIEKYKIACTLAMLSNDDFISLNQRLWKEKKENGVEFGYETKNKNQNY